MDEDGESSEGEGGRIAIIQRQAKRRMLNLRHGPRDSVDTTATLPEYTSSPPAESSSGTEGMPPRYPKLTAEEEADEERDAVGDVVRRVRVRRRRSMSTSHSGSDPYLDSLLARSVHALELSNALLQSSMTTQSSLSALLSHDVDRTLDRSLDSHARFLAGQIHASDARRAWVDDLARQVDSLEYDYEYPPPSPAGSALGLSQSLPDSPGGFLERMRAAGIGVTTDIPSRPSGLQQGERPRSPPPRCMTQYITAGTSALDAPDSILMPSTNGFRAAPRVHSFVPTPRSRQSSGEYSEFARQQQRTVVASGSGSGSSTPVSVSVHSPRRSLSVSAQQSPSAGVYLHGNYSSPQVLQHPSQYASSSPYQYTSHQSHTPVRPVLSAVPAEPSTPAYNMLSAIAMRSPTPDSGASGAGITRSDLGPREPGLRFTNDLGPRFESGRAYGRGRGGSVSVGLGVGGGSGLRRTRSATPSSRGAFAVSPVVSPSARLRGHSTATSTTMSSPSKPLGSPARSKPSSRTASSGSVPSIANPNPSATPGPSQPSPNSRNVVRHPFLQPDLRRQTQTQSEVETEAEEQRFKSAGVLRRILDASKEPEPEEEERGRERAKGKQRARLPTWSVITPTATTVKVETVTPGGVLSIEGISGVVGSKSAVEGKERERERRDPLELPGEHPRSFPVQVKRSQSAGPSNRLGTFFAGASLPKKVPVFGRGGEAEPPPLPGRPSRESDRTVTEGRERPRPRLEIDTEVFGRREEGALRVQLNGATIDTDAGPSDSRMSDVSSESGSEGGSEPSHASLPLPSRLFDQPSRRPSSLRLAGSPRPSGSGASTPRSVTFSPLPPKHVSSGSRPLSEAKAVRRRKSEKEKEKEKPGWFASWFGPLPSPSGSSVKSGGYTARRGWDSPRSMDDWQM